MPPHPRPSATARFRSLAPKALPLVLLLGLPVGGALRAQSKLRDLPTPPPIQSLSENFGAALAPLDDLDGDGRRDLAVAVPNLGAGWIRFVSSRTYDPLLAVLSSATSSVGMTLANVGDLDGDGFDDLVVGYPNHDLGGTDRGLVEVIDGRSGRRLFATAGDAAGWELGTAVCALGDINGDGVPDFAAGAPGRAQGGPGGGPNRGLVRIWSGASFAVLGDSTPNSIPARYGSSIALLGDIYGGGSFALAVGAPGTSEAYVVTPFGGALTRVISGPAGFGKVVARTGDLDGNGTADLAVGDPDAALFGMTDQGAVRVFGSTTGNQLFPTVLGLPGNRFGSAILDIGDFNGSGLPDLLLLGEGGVYGILDGAGSLIAFRSGLPQGPSTAILLGDADGDGELDAWYGNSESFGSRGSVTHYGSAFGPVLATLEGQNGQNTGASVAVLDDLNGDGVREIAYGSPFASPQDLVDQGEVRIDSAGFTIRTLLGSTAEQLGAAIAALGDLDGDGVGEYAVGRPNALFGQGTRTGAITVYSGASGSILRQHFGSTYGERFGASIARVPDVDQDGIDDYAVGAPGRDAANGDPLVGRVVVYSGASGSQVYTASDNVPFGRFGTALAGAEDFTGDGRGDLLVGAPFGLGAGPSRNRLPGRVHLYSGTLGFPLLTLVGSQNGMEFGRALAGLGRDHDGDGVDDFLVGAPRFAAPGGGIGDGRIELRSGADGSVIWSDNGAFEGGLGAALASARDLDNDEIPDFLVGEPNAFLSFTDTPRRGRVRLYSGATRIWTSSLSGEDEGEAFGSAIATGADLDDDRFDDVLVGAPRAGGPVGRPVGEARTWTARAFGSTAFGDGTEACSGVVNLTLLRPARPGQTMELRTTGVEAGALPILLAGDQPDPTGVVLLGARLHITPLVILELPPVTQSPWVFQLPLPNDPSLVGLPLHLQSLVFGPAGCPPSPFPLASSNGLTVVFQP
jgi:hypothetical protein